MEPVLKGISAFVDVWSSNRTENYSKTFEQQLLDMGAKVSKTFNKHVTHVVFKEGRLATWRKAQKTGVKIVSVLWVEKCRETGEHVDESLFPAACTNEGLPLLVRKHKCMQPKDFIERTPENDRKMQRRLDQLAKELAQQRTASNSETDIPILLFEDDGSLAYSPVNKIKDQCSAMERRIKEMKEKRENLSLTGSQMSPTPPCNAQEDQDGPLPTCIGAGWHSADALPEKQMEDCLNSSFDDLWGTDKFKRRRTEVAERVCNTPSDRQISMSGLVNSPSRSSDQKVLTPKQPSRRCLGKKQILQHTLDDKWPPEKEDFKKFANKNQICENTVNLSVANRSSFLQIKGLDHVTPSEKILQLNTTPALTGSHSVSSVSRKDLNVSSFDSSLPVSDCTLQDKRKKKPKLRSNLKLSASELVASGSKKDFLQAITTYNKPLCTEEASYEDYFSSSNANEIQILVPKKSQKPPKVCCNDCLSKIETPDEDFYKPHAPSEKKRENSVPTNDVLLEKNFMPTKHPEIMPLNYMSHEENTENTEALDADAANRRVLDKSYRTCVNYCTRAPGDENEVSECHVTDGPCTLFKEQENKLSEGLRKTRRLPKPTRTLVMTSMSAEKQNTIIQVVNKLGNFLFSDNVCDTTSHVVAGSPRRTLNVMLGIARGCWIVSFDWVLWSLELGHWISEEPYELSSNFPAAPICRLQRHLSPGKYQQNLFSSQPVMFVSPTSQPPCQKLGELIQLSGGRTCKALRQAKICIGEYPGKKYHEIKYISEKWILDSITHHTICPMENYIFQL
ncbi:microcephalin [Nothoprocta perdicaria]|uniref:microcephalin n=1 Tax=Nothoprocta perdicaria TaxID=30464 RepID=UPI000E1BDEFC|nr:microcephalin [Nothoprocta perdicaria]